MQPELLTYGVCDGYWMQGETDLRTICERLVDRGLPSSDNVTAILVQFKDAGRLAPLTGSDDEDDGDDATTQSLDATVEYQAVLEVPDE